MAWKTKKVVKKHGDSIVKIKKTKIPKVKKVVVKPHNSGTFTSSAFWSFIRSALRNKSRFWLPIQECKNKSRRKYNGPNKRQKYEYKCAECGGWFSDKEIAVDHIEPAGSLNNGDDLKGFIERLFCETDNLQVLCEKHHLIKTAQDRAKLKLSKENGNI